MAMLNIVSLPKHLDEIRLLLHDKKMDVLALNSLRSWRSWRASVGEEQAHSDAGRGKLGTRGGRAGGKDRLPQNGAIKNYPFTSEREKRIG